MKYLVVILSILLFSLNALAQTKVSRDARYVYLRTPYSDLSAKARTVATKDGLKALIQALEDLVPNQDGKLEQAGTGAILAALKASYTRVDDLMRALNDYLKAGKNLNILEKKGRPSAFLIHFGGSVASSWWGGSGSLGELLPRFPRQSPQRTRRKHPGTSGARTTSSPNWSS